MANTIYSKVTIEPQEAMDKICDMIESMPHADYGKETKVIVESFYTEEEIKSTYGNGQTESANLFFSGGKSPFLLP